MNNTSSAFDDFSTVVRNRRSIRSFRPDHVPRDVLDRVLDIARWAPSNCNSQPWLTYVVGGARLERLTTGLLEAAASNRMSKDYPYDGNYSGIYKERRADAAVRLYGALGIAREERDRRNQFFMRNYEFFGAPHAIFLCMEDWCGVREAADVGMYAQTLMLAFAAHGIGSCPQTSVGMFADVIREHLELPSEQKVLFGISFGYADDSIVNSARMPRAGVDDSVRHLD